jgi:hypothetical protein
MRIEFYLIDTNLPDCVFDYLLLPIIFWWFIYPVLKSYTGNGGIFFFSIVMYYIAITGYSNPINSSIPFKMGAKILIKWYY